MVKRAKPEKKPAAEDRELGRRLGLLLQRAALRGLIGNTNVALALAVGVTPAAAGKWLRYGKIARQQIVPICKALHCSADELLGLSKMDGDPAIPFRTR